VVPVLKNDPKKSEELLRRALDTVPFYRRRWRRLDPGADRPVEERYAALPLLTKADMRRCFPAGLVPRGMDVGQGLRSGEIEYTFTSGTTGEKVVNLWNQSWWHASEQASWQLHPALRVLRYPPRQATLASALNVGISCEEDLPMDHRLLGNLLYLNEKASLLCWQDYHMERIARELNEYRPAVLEANPSLLARCCWYWLDHGTEVYAPPVITLTYELASQVSLAAIRRVFPSPLVSSYGTTETGFVLESGAEGGLLPNTQTCRIDFLPLRERYGGPELGRIAVSTFDNPWVCILRFDVGDLVRVRPEAGPGGGFAVASVEGRAACATFTTRGELVTPAAADRALARIPGVREYDLVQKAPKRYALRLKLRGGEAAALAAAREILVRLYGEDGEFTVAAAEDLLPGPSGKYRRTHAEFRLDEWSLVEGGFPHA
jgi:phenylacetate-coenzyme A ligase PaaK-like adenylate-forming protein